MYKCFAGMTRIGNRTKGQFYGFFMPLKLINVDSYVTDWIPASAGMTSSFYSTHSSQFTSHASLFSRTRSAPTALYLG